MSLVILALLGILLMLLMWLLRYGWIVLAAAAAALMTAAIVNAMWKTPTRSAANAKWSILVLGVTVAIGLAVWIGEATTPSDKDFREDQRIVQERMRRIAQQPGVEHRFLEMLGAARSGDIELTTRIMETRPLEWFRYLDPNVELSEADLAAAQDLLQRKQPDICATTAWNAYPALRVRQRDITEVADVIESFPRFENCGPLQEYIWFVQVRCSGIWREECSVKLPRERLSALANAPGIGPKIRELLRSVWPTSPAE